MGTEEFRRGVINPFECVREGFQLIKSDYWLLFVIVLLNGLISSISLLIASGAMTCGMFYCFLRKIDREPIVLDDLWKGMKWFLPGLGLVLIIVLPMIAVYAVIYVPIVIATVMGTRLSPEELLGLLLGAFVVDLVLIIVMVCLHTLLMFAFPLMVDRHLGVLGAIKTSARAVLGNLGGVAGLFGLNFLIALGGQLALCIGIYFVMPIIIAGNVAAYRKVFPRETDRISGMLSHTA